MMAVRSCADAEESLRYVLFYSIKVNTPFEKKNTLKKSDLI
jgi:hypothetical protein